MLSVADPCSLMSEGTMKRIVVLGAGFAGLWAALAAAREIDRASATEEIQITVVNRTPYHSIRVRNYEADLTATIIPLSRLLAPAGVELRIGDVTDVDTESCIVHVDQSGQSSQVAYDRLVLATGSELAWPPIPGLREHAFDVDTYAAAVALGEHLRALPKREPADGRNTIVVIGAGLTGLEVATEMPSRLRDIFGEESGELGRVVLLDRLDHVGSDLGTSSAPAVTAALQELGIEARTGVHVQNVDASGLTFVTGERLEAATIIWCGGLRPSPLTALIDARKDPTGRIEVDSFMRVPTIPNVFVAGDAASAMVDADHRSVMSCQHGRPMGRFAGHNAAADLLGRDMIPLEVDWYTTIVDLGPWGAVYTRGWDRKLIAAGYVAKKTKQTINRIRIYPPSDHTRAALLSAAAPVLQRPPEVDDMPGADVVGC